MADNSSQTTDAKKAELEDAILPDDFDAEALDNPKGTEATDTSTEETGSDETAEDSENDADESSEAQDDSADARAEQNRLAALRRVQERDASREKLEAERQEHLNSIDDEDKRRIANLEWDNYINRVSQTRENLLSDAEAIRREYPMFDPNSKDFNKDLYERSMKRFARDSAEADSDGNIISVKTRLRDYLKEEAELFLAGSKTGSRKQSNAKAKMDAAAERPTGSTAPKKTAQEEDPFLAGFNSVK